MEILNNTSAAFRGIQVDNNTVKLHLKVPVYKNNQSLYMWEKRDTTKHTLDLIILIKDGLIEYKLHTTELHKLGTHEAMAHSKKTIAESSGAVPSHTILNLIKLESNKDTIHIEYVSGF